MTFDEGEHTVIGTLPAQGWQVGSASCFEECDVFGWEPVIGFLIVRHDRGNGCFDVDSYPLTYEGVRTKKDDQVLKDSNGTVWTDGSEFSTEEKCGAFLRGMKALGAVTEKRQLKIGARR
jgi:hypothetical protein